MRIRIPAIHQDLLGDSTAGLIADVDLAFAPAETVLRVVDRVLLPMRTGQAGPTPGASIAAHEPPSFLME